MQSVERRFTWEWQMTAHRVYSHRRWNLLRPRRTKVWIDLLPTKILLKVFSSLSIPQLLRADDVCQRWKRLIHEEYWTRLKWITKETIGHPDGDCRDNFIALSRRVVQVKGFVDPFLLVDSIPLTRYTESELRTATLELVKKLSPDASFPLSLIQSVVKSLFMLPKGIDLREYKRNIDMSNKAALLDHVMHVYSVYKFQYIRLNEMLIHSTKYDRFHIDLGLEIPVLENVTQLTIGYFAIYLFWHRTDSVEYCYQAHRLWTRLSQHKRLASIEISQVHLMAHQAPNFEIILEFHQDKRQFSAPNIEKWFEDGRVKRVGMHVEGNIFFTMQNNVVNGVAVLPIDLLKATMVQRVLSCVDTLRIFYDEDANCYGTRLDAVNALHATGVLSQLKSLTISLVCSSGEQEAVTEVEMILRAIKDDMHDLESLTLGFSVSDHHCPARLLSLRNVAVLNGPLPRLLNLKCTHSPCLPFIVSVVSQAPNLRRLSVDSKPFEDDSLAVWWTNKLVESLHACRHLQYLRIPKKKATRIDIRKSDAEMKAICLELNRSLVALKAMESRLDSMFRNMRGW